MNMQYAAAVVAHERAYLQHFQAKQVADHRRPAVDIRRAAPKR
ncbi:MAG TPA: hypothetical protein VFB19_20205 [Mycobacterium sp.]|nr:hypothetical protein [Mycobacterium sp.]